VADKIRLSSTEGGGNWWRVITWAADGFAKSGFEVELKRFGPHGDDTCARVATDESDICATLKSFAHQAVRGTPPFSDRSKDVRGLANILHPGHIFYAIVTKELGVTSFADLARKKPKLNLCVPGDQAGQDMVSAMLEGYGIGGLDEVRSWGGEFFHEYAEAGRLVLAGKSDGIMRENTRLGPVGQASNGRDMVLLSLDRPFADKLADRFGLDPIELPPGFLRGQAKSAIALENGGYPLVVGAHMDDGVAYRLAKAINETFPAHYTGEDIFYSPKHAPATGCPLHPGAARYYRELGVLK
jgi:TRAP-type uncharacterized transport system substrate-binding protein